MNKFVPAALCGMLCAPVFAQDGDRADLKQMAESESVQEALEEDGVSIDYNEEGDFVIFARGSGTYDFDDPDDRKAAKEEAVLNAKAAISKFLNETLSTDEAIDQQSKKAKTLSKSGDVSTQAVSSEMVKTQLKSIRNHSESILTGVITLKSEKIPSTGSGGEIQVTVVTSPLTQQAAKEISNSMTDSLNDRTKVIGNGSNVGGEGAAGGAAAGAAGGAAAGGATAGPAGAPSKKTGPDPNNKRETRKNKTLF